MHHTISRYVLMMTVGIYWLLLPSVLLAEPPNRIETIMELCPLIREAIQHNPEIAATQKQVHVLKERVPQARSLEDPEVKVQLWNTPESLNVTKTGTTIYGLAKRFPVPGLLSQQEEVAIHEANQAAQKLAAKIQEITSSVTVAYYMSCFLRIKLLPSIMKKSIC